MKFSAAALSQAEAASARFAERRAPAPRHDRTSIDTAPLIRAYGDAYPKLRASAERVHQLEHEYDDEIKRCSVILLAPASMAKLMAALGSDMPRDADLSVYTRWSTKEEREPVDAKLRSACRRKVFPMMIEIGRDLATLVIADLQADLNDLLKAGAPLHAKYGFVPEGGPLANALRAAIDTLTQQRDNTGDAGEDIRQLANRWFTEPIPEIANPPAIDLDRLNAAVVSAKPVDGTATPSGVSSRAGSSVAAGTVINPR